MSGDDESATRRGSLALIVRRVIAATPERVFEAWTCPAELQRWWGPKPVTCTAAEVDLQVGGRYRIANRLPDGTTLWISGQFERIDRPRQLVYTWCVGPGSPRSERVTVTFEAHPMGTQVVVVHERIADAATSARHEQGWLGCLDGLAAYLSGGV
jgi:uncharacterized protein YndB with AHSA1/START domain